MIKFKFIYGSFGFFDYSTATNRRKRVVDEMQTDDRCANAAGPVDEVASLEKDKLRGKCDTGRIEWFRLGRINECKWSQIRESKIILPCLTVYFNLRFRYFGLVPAVVLRY